MSRQIAKRYILQDIIGKGGNGIVYTAMDKQTDTVVAVKQLRPEQIDTSPDILERFKREGEALRELNHPNIVKMLDMVEDEGHQFLVEEYFPDGDLNQELKKDIMPVDRIIKIALGLADALTRAHQLNIIHRDLKPGNVLIAEDGTARLTDFGVALIGSKKRMTEQGTPVGTIEYLSPEALTADVDNRADIWSFGIMMFEMLTRERPFRGKSLSEIVGKILTAPPADLEQLRPDAPLALIDLTYRMLEKDRNERIPSVRLIGAELEAILQGSVLDTDKIPIASASLLSSRFSPNPVVDSATRHNLPANAQSFVGREYEINEILRLIDDHTSRIITIQGTGGIGKTRLALEVGFRALSRFDNRVFFIDLAPLRDSALIVTAIAEAIHFKFQQDERPQLKQLLDYLEHKHALLIIDNLEHLMDGITVISDILGIASQVNILVTSRQRLNQSGESVMLLQGMEFPEDSPYHLAIEFSAVKLFQQNARRIRPNFEIAPDEISSVSQICHLVEGLPLGIILAASWVGMLSIEEIANEIEQSADFLSTDMSDLPERHRSMRAVFDYSWHLLTESEKAVFMKMAAFRAGFSRDAAIEVVGANLRMMMLLMNKSLLRRDPDTGRYSIHDLLRNFAKEKLSGSNFEATVRDAHMRFYCQLANQEATQLFGGAQLRAMETLDAELDNIRSAWRYAIEQKSESQLSVLRPLWIYYDILGIWDEVIEMAEESLDALGHPQNETAGDLLTMAGICAYRHGELEKATEYNTKARKIFETLDIPQKQILPRVNQLNVKTVQGKYEETIEEYSELITLAHQYNLKWEETTCHLNLGFTYTFSGKLDEAEESARQAIEIARQSNDMIVSGTALHNLGDIIYRKGDPQTAKDILTESLSVGLMFDNILLIYANLIYLSKSALELGDFMAAADYAYRASDIADENRLQIRLHVSMIATISCLQGHYDQARIPLRELLNFVLDNEMALVAEPEILEALPLLLDGLGRRGEAASWTATLLNMESSDHPVIERLENLQQQYGQAEPINNIRDAIQVAFGIIQESSE